MAIERFFPVQDSVLLPQAIAERVLPLYGLNRPYACRFYRKGPCDAYQIGTAEGRYFLKVYRHGRRSWLDMTEKIRLLRHLSAHDVSVASPVSRLDGEHISQLSAPEGVRYAVLFREAVGEEERTDEHRRALGTEVARLHTVADQLDPPYARTSLSLDTLPTQNLEAIEELLSHRPEDFRLIQAIAEQVTLEVQTLLSAFPPEYGVCHGDLHGGDVRYDHDGRATLFDFDNSGNGWRAMDIGVYLCHQWMDTSAEAETLRQEQLSQFLAGYETVRRLSAGELRVIQITPPIRHIFLMGHVLRQTTVHDGWYWANDDFIDWHMKWFRYWRDQR